MGSPEAPSEGPTVGAPTSPEAVEAGDPTLAEPPRGPEGATEAVPKRSLRERTAELRARAEEAKRSAAARAEDLRARHASVRVAFAAYERDRRQAGGLLAGGLAFRIFLWLLPTALAVVSVMQLMADVSSESPEAVADSAGLGAALAATVGQAAEASGSSAVWLLILGIFLMLWAGLGMMKALRLLASVAWQIRPTALAHAVRAAAIFSGVALAIVAFPLLLGPLYAGGILGDLVASVITIVALAAVLTWAMTKLPHPEDVTWLGFVPGALVIAVGAEIIRIVTAVYFAPRLGRTSDLYGALGLAAVFLAWLYLIGRIVVAGLALNAELWRARQRAAGADGGEGGPGTNP